ncbi:hypothetical protein LUZ60_014403 [Juncus effusus]|nr:hypothetical protein LUZ60_014403 [Juncus effusus]
MSSPNLNLPLIDLSNPERISTAKSIHQACVEYGFFYLINHRIDDSVIKQVFEESKKFFNLAFDEKMKLERSTDHRGYTVPYAETLDPSQLKGDPKESFYIGPMQDGLNKWPSQESLPIWRETMILYFENILDVGTRLISLIALALDLDENFFDKIGAFNPPMPFLRLLHYQGEISPSDKGNLGLSAHSDYGMITLLLTDGVPGLQICREKDKRPQIWEDVSHIDGALIVNIGDMLERWTNGIFRSTMHRVVAVGQERYSAAFFLDPNYDCMVECLESCHSETSPPRFPPIKMGEYIHGRFKATYGS